MANEPVQAGTEVVVGFQGMALTGYVPEEGAQWMAQAYGQKEELTDTNGNVRTKVRAGRYEEYQLELVIDTPATGRLDLGEGDTLTITPPNEAGSGDTPIVAEIQEGAAITFNRLSAKLNVTLRKEDTMSYTTTTTTT